MSTDNLTSALVKKAALEFGADIAGIGNVERWDSAPKENDPRTIMPRARSVICLAFRIHRGSLRGVEEQTYYSGYTSAGYAEINAVTAPNALRRLTSFIEDYGYETVPIMPTAGKLGTKRGTPQVGKDGSLKPAPDIFLSNRIGAVLCGVGQIGYSRLVLTREFGPLQRLSLLITEAELEPDPIITDLCDYCMLCAKNCPGHAILSDETDDLEIPGICKIHRCLLDENRCKLVHTSGALSPFAPPEAREYALNIINGTTTTTADGKPRPSFDEMAENVTAKVAYTQNVRRIYHELAGAVCTECMRTCVSHLDKRGKLTHKFKHDFR